MAVIEMSGALDLWTLFNSYIFGSFWLSVLGLSMIYFIMMGILGRISIYSVTWYVICFLLAMTLGYGYVFLNVLITMVLLSFTIYIVIDSWINIRGR